MFLGYDFDFFPDVSVDNLLKVLKGQSDVVVVKKSLIFSFIAHTHWLYLSYYYNPRECI